MTVRPDQKVETDWVDVNQCVLGNRTPMAPEAVQVSCQRMVCLGDNSRWPPIVGHWAEDRFVVCDGRHEFLAALMRGRQEVFVAWLAPRRTGGDRADA